VAFIKSRRPERGTSNWMSWIELQFFLQVHSRRDTTGRKEVSRGSCFCLGGHEETKCGDENNESHAR
jgi:hypothetical protein